MRKTHEKNTVRYFLFIVFAFLILFFSGDFGTIDVQKTAIVMAVGVDRNEDTFIVTSQISVPQASKQGKAGETVQIVSRGKTVAEAFEEINVKTGWYPKLVFCHLILLGEKTAEQNVFDALGFFLLDEYMSDNCLVATCDGLAKDLLNVTALVDPSGSVAMQKVLSPHAERVGTVLPSTLREFAIGYYSESKSGYLPILKTQPQQEKIEGEKGGESGKSQGSSGGSSGGGSSGGGSSGGGSSGGGSGGSSGENASGQKSEQGGAKQGNEKPVFSASETALFLDGKRVGKLTQEETFAFNAIENELRLAAYTVENEGKYCTLSVKRNSPKRKFTLGENGQPTLKIQLSMTAGLLDDSSAITNEVADAGDVPNGAFQAAEKRLAAQIHSTFDKCRACGCDLFKIIESIQKKEHKHLSALKDSALENSILEVSVRFRNVR